jgi:hypothetical protein
MNRRIILQLSSFGFIMALGTISLIPEKIEFVFWLFILAVSGLVIGKACEGKYFLHGFLVGMANCLWVTLFHILFTRTYLANHPAAAAASAKMPRILAIHPRLAMAIIGPIIGAITGSILGLIAFITSRIVKRDAPLPD